MGIESHKLVEKQLEQNMKILIVFAMLALISIVMGDGHGCPEGQVEVENSNQEKICVACEDTLKSGGCGGSPKRDMCPAYKKFCTSDRLGRYIRMKCPVTCGLCGSNK